MDGTSSTGTPLWNLTADNDGQSNVAAEFITDSDALMIAFSSHGGHLLGLNAFDFYKLTSNYPINRLYLRDPKRVWYHEGIPELGESIDEVASALRRLIEAHNFKRVMTVGASSGGYAALLFGCLLHVDRVLAFSPQTALDRVSRLLQGELIREREIQMLFRRLYDSPGYERRFANLRKVFQHHEHLPQIDIYYAHLRRFDRAHTMRLKSFPNVTLHPYADTTHRIATLLRDNGELERLLRQAVDAL